MFTEFFRKKAEEIIKKARPSLPGSVPETCKRAMGFFPVSAHSKEESRNTASLRFHHLLVSLEGSERTGCMKVSSARYRSRSALLLFRGRVVGAVYGCKSLRGQYLHEDAHRRALHDLAAPGNSLDAYELPEDLVLAAASLFYGETLDTNFGQNPESTFDYALSCLMRSGMPGCLVVNTLLEETICIVYVARGGIVGVFSAVDGWTHGTPASTKRFMRDRACKIHAALLPGSEQPRLGFSLTGLGDLPGTVIDATPCQDFSPSPVAANSARQSMSSCADRHCRTAEAPQAVSKKIYTPV